MTGRLTALRARVGWALNALRLSSDSPSLARMLALRDWDPSAEGVPIALRILDGRSVRLRPGTSDIWTLETLLPPVHLPPPEVSGGRVGLIWDLGANIGLTIAHAAVRFPSARIVGVELDEGNASLCRSNTSPWRDRCEVIRSGVWTTDGEISYASLGPREQQGMHVEPEGGDSVAPALSLNTLAARLAPGDRVDFVKMDIEGAEREVLNANTEWAERVRSIKVEVHEPYTVEACAGDLARLGFTTRLDDQWNAAGVGKPPVIGVRTN